MNDIFFISFKNHHVLAVYRKTQSSREPNISISPQNLPSPCDESYPLVILLRHRFSRMYSVTKVCLYVFECACGDAAGAVATVGGGRWEVEMEMVTVVVVSKHGLQFQIMQI